MTSPDALRGDGAVRGWTPQLWAILFVLGGRAADLLGRRRVFLVALAVFALVSVFGGLVSSPGLLIAARFVKGAAAAFTAPAAGSTSPAPSP